MTESKDLDKAQSAKLIRAARLIHPDFTAEQIADLTGIEVQRCYRIGFGLTVNARICRYIEANPHCTNRTIAAALNVQMRQVEQVRYRLRRTAARRSYAAEHCESAPPREPAGACVHDKARELRGLKAVYAISRSFAAQWSGQDVIELAFRDGPVPTQECCARYRPLLLTAIQPVSEV